MSPTLLVVQHVDHEDAALVGELARQRGLTLEILRPDRGDPLPDPRACANSIALVLGGPMSVNDRDQPGMDWLRQELDWLRAWHQQRRPVLGICLGAQLLAVAAGGSVQPLQVGAPPQQLKELGLGAIHWVADPSDEACSRGNQAAAWCCIGMVIASTSRLMQPCWVLHCTAPNRCFGSEPTPLACNATSRSTAMRWNAGSPTTTTTW